MSPSGDRPEPPRGSPDAGVQPPKELGWMLRRGTVSQLSSGKLAFSDCKTSLIGNFLTSPSS